MSAKYKSVQRGNPLNPTAAKKFYAQPVSRGEATLKQVKSQINDMTSVNSADSSASIDAFTQVLIQRIANGEIVRLGDLGSFQLSFSSTGVDTEAQLNATLIKNPKVVFRPGKDIKDMLKTLQFEKE
jgi:predicted histone-like DNA-binding protein